MTNEITITGLDRLEQAIKIAPEITVKALTGAMHQATLVAQNEIVPLIPVAGGNLAGSVTRRVQPDSAGVEGIVGTNVPYALWVEEDTKPHWPPLEPILEWVRKKKISGVYSLKTGNRMGNKAKNAAADRQIAFLIARKISREGTKGRHMFSKGLSTAESKINRIFNEAVDDILRVFRI